MIDKNTNSEKKIKSAKIEGTKKIMVCDMKRPPLLENQVSIKVNYCGICGSDLHLWEEGHESKGLVMGHEFSGVIEDAGITKDFKKGDRVVCVTGNRSCLKCETCKEGYRYLCPNQGLGIGCDIHEPGAYAEYVVCDSDYLIKIPDSITDKEAALIEPATIALHAVKIGKVQPSSKVLILGAGIIGLLSAAFARLGGASFVAITDINPSRVQLAEQLGDVNIALNGKDPEVESQLIQISEGGFDCCIDCTGAAAAINLGINILKTKGILALVGINMHSVSINTLPVLLKEIKLQGVFGSEEKDFIAVQKYIEDKRFQPNQYISKTIGLDDVQSELEQMTTNQAYKETKVMIKPIFKTTKRNK